MCSTISYTTMWMIPPTSVSAGSLPSLQGVASSPIRLFMKRTKPLKRWSTSLFLFTNGMLSWIDKTTSTFIMKVRLVAKDGSFYDSHAGYKRWVTEDLFSKYLLFQNFIRHNRRQNLSCWRRKVSSLKSLKVFCVSSPFFINYFGDVMLVCHRPTKATFNDYLSNVWWWRL